MLNGQQILAACEPPAGTVDVPEWGGSVGIRRLSAAEVRGLRTDNEGEDNLRSLARFVGLVLCDELGRRLFDDASFGQLESRGFAALLRISREAQRLNAMTSDERETIGKNSETVPTGDGT